MRGKHNPGKRRAALSRVRLKRRMIEALVVEWTCVQGAEPFHPLGAVDLCDRQGDVTREWTSTRGKRQEQRSKRNTGAGKRVGEWKRC